MTSERDNTTGTMFRVVRVEDGCIQKNTAWLTFASSVGLSDNREKSRQKVVRMFIAHLNLVRILLNSSGADLVKFRSDTKELAD